MPALAALDEVLKAWPDAEVQIVPVPADCVDGFLAAFWRRPDAYLAPAVRSGISSFSRVSSHVLDDGIARLAADLESGDWRERNRELLDLQAFDAGYRLVVRNPI